MNYVTTFGVEITDLKQAEENYRFIAECAHDVVAVLDGDFDPLYISPSAERLFGYSIEDFAHKSIFDFVHAEDRDETGHWDRIILNARDITQRESDHYVVLVKEVTDLVRTHEELRTLIAERNTPRELNHHVPNTELQMTSEADHT